MSMEVPRVFHNIFGYINENKRKFIDNLADAVEIPSITRISGRRQDAIYMVNWMNEKMIELGIKTKICHIGNQKLYNGEEVSYPPFILGVLGKDENKKTVLIYGHLDVCSADKEDGWNTDPFTLVEIGGKLYGRGASENKGPCLAWIHAIEAYIKTDTELPVNIKILYAGSSTDVAAIDGLIAALEKNEKFLESVDFICSSDHTWLGLNKPCIGYGFRGCCFFHVEISCAKKDLHSGRYGGAIIEGMNDLLYIFNRLVDSNGTILIPGIYDEVEVVTPQEERLYASIDFDVDEYKQTIGKRVLKYDDKVKLLMARWRYPSLSIHEIRGLNSSDTFLINKKVLGKFSIRLVGNQEPIKIAEIVKDYIESLWKAKNSKNKIKVMLGSYGKPWTSAINHENYRAARRASVIAYGMEPDMIRFGKTLPMVVRLEELFKKNIVIIPMGKADDNVFSPNEKLDIVNYINGTKLFAAYLFELAQ